MKPVFFLIVSTAASLAMAGGAAAGTSGAVYDMSFFLAQPHPFAARSTSPRPMARRPAPTAVQAQPRRVAVPTPPTATLPSSAIADSGAGGGLSGIFSEIRGGFLVHDEGMFSHNKESGFDGNLELLFTSPELLKVIWEPRPHMGFTVNSAGNTSQAYLGLTWEWEFLGDAFFDFSLGGAYHNGETTTTALDKKELGCSVLFRESLDLGYRFFGAHSLMFHLAHISNAKLCSTNEGLETFGVRYGYRF